jgi:hypothetical protein
MGWARFSANRKAVEVGSIGVAIGAFLWVAV